jgi:shikimate kinase
MKRIYLIGLPGSGKSTSGKRFARQLGWGYADLDKLIEMRAHKRIADIFKEEGEDYFREIEAACLRETGASERLVVGCGGGAAAWGDNINWMLAHGKVVWLNISLDELSKRLSISRRSRPLFPSRQATDIHERLVKLLEKRAFFYQQAHFTVDSEAALMRLAQIPDFT